MSFVFFFVLLFIGAVMVDSLFWWRCAGSLHGRRMFGWGLVFSYLPLLAMILLLGLSRDNTTGLMAACMWLFWIWLFLFLPRLIFYPFWGIDLPHFGTVLAVGVAGLLVWGVTVGRTSLRVNRVEIFFEKLPASFDGFRIVQLSDMHVGTVVSPKRELQRIVDSVQSLRPDLIVFTGDLVNVRSWELNDRIAAILRGLQAPFGVISVTGNHDVGGYIKDTVRQSPAESAREVIAWQQRLGWQVLQDTTVYLSRGGERISVSGISFDPALRKKRHDSELPPARLDVVYRGVPDSLFNLTAVHLPQLWSQVVERGYGDLTLSGHVHSMQMKIRLFGRAFSPAHWLYERWSGLYSDRKHALYINDGTGYVAYPMRLGAWPEITLITLRTCE